MSPQLEAPVKNIIFKNAAFMYKILCKKLYFIHLWLHYEGTTFFTIIIIESHTLETKEIQQQPNTLKLTLKIYVHRVQS